MESSDQPGSWSVELSDADGAPFAGSDTVIVHFDEADFAVPGTSAQAAQQRYGTVVESA